MDKNNFPELDSIELERTRKELGELKQRVEKYEKILKQHDLLDTVPVVSEVEELCLRELKRLNELSAKNIPLSLEDVKIFDLYSKNLMLARGKAVPVEGKKQKKEEKHDLAVLLKLAGSKEEE